jgi:Protein of unknown function (DUF3429)
MHYEPSQLAQRIGYAGLVPFVLLAILVWTLRANLQAYAAIALVGYGAVIASFLGGLHWGIAGQLPAHNAKFHYLWGVMPSLMGWAAMMVPASAGLTLMALVLLACYGVDRSSYPRAGWAAWLPMRLRLTMVSALSCALGAAALLLKHHA